MDISIKHQATSILKNNPEYTRELIILLGVIQLCKVMDVDSFEILINSFGIKSNQWWPLINEITDDGDEWENMLDGELYQTILDLQLWLTDYKHDIIEGSMLYYLMQKRDGK